MSKERWLIGVAALAVILGVVLYGAALVTGRNREAAVAKLKAKGAAIAARHRPAPNSPKTQPAARSNQVPEKPRTAPSGEDTVAAFTRMLERNKAVRDDPKWTESLDILENKNPREWSAVDRAKAAEFLTANQELIHEIVRLADAGGPLYELDYSKGLFGMPIPHLAQLRDCAHLLAGVAAFRAGEGDYEQAVEDVLAGMKLADALKDEPILNSQISRMVMDLIMINAVEKAIPGENLPPGLAGKLIEYASHSAAREVFADSINADGYVGLEAFDLTRSGDLGRTGLYSEAHWNRDDVLWHVYGSAIARPWLNVDEESYAEIMARMGDPARLPFYDAKPVLDQIKKDIDDLPATRFLSRTLLIGLTYIVEEQAQHEARLDLMRLGLAVEQYHARTGAYPETLDAVASTVGGSVPLDPFTGRSYGYQPSGAGFVLYSAIGSAVDLSVSSSRRGADENGDFVWRGLH